jgi:hypothetical protein
MTCPLIVEMQKIYQGSYSEYEGVYMGGYYEVHNDIEYHANMQRIEAVRFLMKNPNPAAIIIKTRKLFPAGPRTIDDLLGPTRAHLADLVDQALEIAGELAAAHPELTITPACGTLADQVHNLYFIYSQFGRPIELPELPVLSEEFQRPVACTEVITLGNAADVLREYLAAETAAAAVASVEEKKYAVYISAVKLLIHYAAVVLGATSG